MPSTVLINLYTLKLDQIYGIQSSDQLNSAFTHLLGYMEWQRRQSDLKSGVVDPGEKISIYPGNFSNDLFLFIQANLPFTATFSCIMHKLFNFS